MGQNLPWGVLGSSSWSGVCRVSPSPSSYLHPKTLGAEAAPRSRLAQFLAQEEGECLGPRSGAGDSSQLTLLGRFILPALSLPDTEHRPGKGDPKLKLCCITALAFLSTRTGTRGDLPGGLCFALWLGSPGRKMHKTLVIWEALGCSSPYRVCPAAFEQALAIMKGL